ncbi:MAG TPA: ChaN family lipoprotein [Spirochaetota bacterium]|nr:ChaN family lipoprotein [Spirochaetota bacterium]
MKQYIIIILLLITASPLYSSDKPAYRIFRGDGTESSYRNMVSSLGEKDIILFGEVHGNPVAHWLEFELGGDLFRLCKDGGRNFIMGGEMFDADTQTVITEYLQGHISSRSFRSESRPWPNYERDYRRILELAGTEKIPFIATNVPKRYASMVFRKGLDSLNNLSVSAKKYIAPLPIRFDASLSSYRDIESRIPSNVPGHSSGHLAEAQALRDATMAHFIFANIKPGGLFFHINGSYHSARREGIAWHLLQRKPGLKIGIIATVSQKDIAHLREENKGIADFILAVPASMPGAR